MGRCLIRTRAARAIAALLLAAGSGAALAADDNPTLAGAGVRSRPDYEGADHRTVDIVPLLRFYRGPWFARTTQGMLEGGARYALAEGLVAGAQLAYEAGPRDGDAGASLGAHLEWDTAVGPAPLNLLARLRQHLDADRGREADLRATLGVFEGGGFTAGVFAQATWASARHQATYYGVNDGGLFYTGAGVLGSYDISRSVVALGSAELRTLGDEAAGSSFVQERSTLFASLGVAYRF